MKMEITFRKSIDAYLKKHGPQYDGDKFNFVEEDVQYRFMRFLSHEGYSLQIEPRYPQSTKRYDILAAQKKGKPVYIEIEWSAKWTDCFLAHTFNDLWKLLELAPGRSPRAFFAVNISDKFSSFPKQWKTFSDINEIPFRSNNMAIHRVWKKD